MEKNSKNNSNNDKGIDQDGNAIGIKKKYKLKFPCNIFQWKLSHPVGSPMETCFSNKSLPIATTINGLIKSYNSSLQGGMQGNSQQGNNTSNANVYMCDQMINLQI